MRTSQHTTSSMMLRAPLAIAVLALTFAGCNCGGTGTQKNHPDVRLSTSALSFEACPAVDDQGQPIPDVFPAKQIVTIENVGKAPAVLTYTFEGTAKDRYSINPETKVESLAAGASQDLEILFAPSPSGDQNGALVVDDGDEDTTDPIRVALQGSVYPDLGATPRIKISFDDGAGNWSDCLESPTGSIDNCFVLFPDTFLDQTSTVHMKVQNLGCPTLKVTNLSVAPFSQGDVPQFFIDQPSVLPSTTTPATMNVVDGSPTIDMVLRFEPKDDGSGDGQRYGYLNISSNASNSPDTAITIYGLASQPAIYVTPSFCDFTDPSDTCNGTKVTTTGTNKRATFEIMNGGNSDVTVTKADFRAPSSGRFAIGAPNPVGQVIAPGASVPLNIDYTDAPLYVTDLIDIEGTANNALAGKSTIRLSGGVLPCLSTNPADQLDFSDVTGSTGSKPVEICNCQDGGVLVLNSVTIPATNKFFKLAAPVPAGTQVQPGACYTANINFTRPVSGGLQTESLTIASNDPKYGPPSNYLLNLYSAAPTDLLPVAVLKGPAGQETAFSVSLASLNPKRVTISGTDSYDPQDQAASVPVTQYQFYLYAPSGATATLTQNSTPVDGVKTTNGVVDVNVDPNKTGTYTVYLTVFDSAGQASPQTSLKIFVNP